MIELRGKYNTAKVFTDNVEQGAVSQIINLLNQPFAAGSAIRVMPDCHAGAGCTIGTTMTVTETVVPNLVGVDIGCGMEAVLLSDRLVEPGQLDKVIHGHVPAGYLVRNTPHPFSQELDLALLRCAGHVNITRAIQSVGTLGGGNHFIELDADEEGRLWLVIHSGSRNLGKQVAEHYQKAAAKELERRRKDSSKIIAALKAQGREAEIEGMLAGRERIKIEPALAFADGQLFEDYIHDMEITQRYADLNRRAMADEIVRRMKLKPADSFSTVHNYIETAASPMILRKGAISAKEGERVLIPMNMRDGSLICTGKGNPDWNWSAPHGAGRIMSRHAAKERFTLSQFRESMKGIYSSTVNKSTIDEAAFAYKPPREIIENITDTVGIVSVLKPVYNFKAAEDER